MCAQLVLGGIGAVIGGIYGGPAGAQMGWAIGSAIGSIIDPPKGPTVEGPRLNDLKTQTADYGTVLPVVYGTVRLAGNVIWSDDIKEKKIKKKEDGKGGPVQTTITYVYTCSFAVGLCEGEIEGVRRIIANGELFYSATANATAGTISESGKAKGSFRVYKGTPDQLPDPTIESVKGAGNATAYRNVAYVVFTDLDLEKFGRRLPNLEFEVVKAGVTTTYRVLNDQQQDSPISPEDWAENTINVGGYYSMIGSIGPRFVSSSSGYYRYSSPIVIEEGGSNVIEHMPGNIWEFNANVAAGEPLTVVKSTQEWDDRPAAYQRRSKQIDGQWYDMAGICRFGPIGNGAFIDLFMRTTPLATFENKLGTPGVLMHGGGYTAEPITQIPIYVHGVYDLSWRFPDEYLDQYFMGASPSSDQQSFIVFSGPNPISLTSNSPVNFADRYYIFRMVEGVPTCVSTGTMHEPYEIFRDLGGMGTSLSFGGKPFTATGCLEGNGNHFWSADWSRIVWFEIVDGVMIKRNETFIDSLPAGTWQRSIMVADGVALSIEHPVDVSDDKIVATLVTRNPYITQAAVPLWSIVEDQLKRVGYDPSEYDVTGLTDMVDGFFLSNRPTARTAIETLTSPYFFDAVESDSVLKFVKRGSQPIRTITALEMGASDVSSASDRPETLLVIRNQELALPLEIAAQYQDRDADYRIGVQYARRQLTKSVNQVSIQLPLVLTATKTKQVVDTVLFNAYKERERFEFSTDKRHIDLEPTDVIRVQSLNGNTWTCRIVNRQEGGDGSIKWEAVGEEPSIYDPLGVGVSVPPTTGDQLLGSVPTFQIVFNAPPLQNTIDAPGFYVAATGYTEGWAGSIAMRSLDSGSTYNLLDNTVVDRSEDSAMGFCSTILGDWEGGNILDTENSLVVSIVGLGQLASTSYQNVLNGFNSMWVGGEIVQFEQATQINANTYRLSRLRRGRLGTERFIKTHVKNEQFVLLNANDTQFQPDAIGNIGAPVLIKGVSLDNQDPLSVQSSGFTFDGTVIRPLSPVQAFGITQPSGEVQFKWNRRARINGEWLSNVEVPLDEPSELYEIDIATDADFSTIVRVAAANSPSYVYTEADRLADTGSTSGPLFVRVCQLSSRVGRGFTTNFEIV